MDELTNTELAVLGLLAERPKHGYQIEQEIALRGMRDWTEIGFSSIYYVLNKLAGAGWLASELSAEEEEDLTTKRDEIKGEATAINQPAAVDQPAATPRTGRRGRGGPARRVYHMTAAGWEGLRAGVRQRLENPRPRSGDFDLALANLPALSPAEVRAALETCRAGLRERIAQVRAKQQAGRPFPPHVEALFSRGLTMMAAELKWIDDYLVSMETAHGNNFAEDRSQRKI